MSNKLFGPIMHHIYEFIKNSGLDYNYSLMGTYLEDIQVFHLIPNSKVDHILSEFHKLKKVNISIRQIQESGINKLNLS